MPVIPAGALALSRAVCSRPGFESLDLNENEISEEGVEELEAAFKKAFPGKQVRWRRIRQRVARTCHL